MALLDGLRRLIVGEPVFQESDTSQPAKSKDDFDDAAELEAARAESTRKVIPLAKVENLEYRSDNDTLELDIIVKNASDVTLMMDRIDIFGKRHEIDHYLKPGESREFTVYIGPKLTNTQFDDCWLQYKNEDGDYFATYHYVEYKQESDSSYVPRRFKFVPPIKDV